jgi:hypothetical protein
MKNRTHYTKVEDFLLDDDFIRYTFDHICESANVWTEYQYSNHPAHSAFLRATNILQHVDDNTYLSEAQSRRLKQRIYRSVHAVYN